MIPSGQLKPAPKPPAPVFSGAVPLSVMLMRNDVLNRAVIDLAGEGPATVGFARNRYDRLEKTADMLLWLAATIIAPVVVDNYLSEQADRRLRQRFSQYLLASPPKSKGDVGKTVLHRLANRLEGLGKHSVVRAPWEFLGEWLGNEAEHSSRAKGLPHVPLGKRQVQTGIEKLLGTAEQRATLVKEIGFHSEKALIDFFKNSAARNGVLAAKMGILVADLAIMGGANLLGAWGKNWLTENISGKKGFSGEFNYANQAYLDEQAAEYDKHKRRRFRQSVALVGGLTVGVPAMVLAGIHSKGKTVLGRGLKALTNSLNYHQGVYTSKWLMLWGGFLSWLGVYTLAARDKHERREDLIHAAVLVPTYIVGDDVVSGIGAKWLQARQPIAKHGINLMKKNSLGLPEAKPLWDVLAEVGHNTAHPVYKAAKLNSWLGLLGATALTATAIPLINHPWTRKAAMAEQEKQSPLSESEAIKGTTFTDKVTGHIYTALSGKSPVVKRHDPPLIGPNFNQSHAHNGSVGVNRLKEAISRFDRSLV